jgi:DNA-binding transcriptional LysR family regulator
MNLRHIEFVVAAAAERSFSRAAERCHVTQPTLSNGIALLEAEFGGQLFIRNTRKVELSPLGLQLLPLIESVHRAHGELKAGARSYYDPAHRILRIGLSPLVDLRRVTEVLEPYERANNGCKTFFKEYFLSDLDERLRSAQLDMVIWPRQPYVSLPKAMVCVPFYVEDLYYLSRHEIPAAGRGSPGTSIREIAGETFVLGPDGCGLASVMRGLFKKAGLKLNEYSGQALSYQVMQDWADIGIGATALPRSKFSPQFAQRALQLLTHNGRPAQVSFDALWMKETAYPRHVAELHHHFRTRAPKIMSGRLALDTAVRTQHRERVAA